MIRHLDTIQRTVAAHYSIRLAEMCSHRKERVVARPRQVAMYLCKKLTALSLPQIGRGFGGRDHTTVMHACKVVTALMLTDPDLAQQVDDLTKLLEAEFGKPNPLPTESQSEVHARRIAKHLEFGLLRLARLNPSEFMTRFAPEKGKPTLIEVEQTLRTILVTGDRERADA